MLSQKIHHLQKIKLQLTSMTALSAQWCFQIDDGNSGSHIAKGGLLNVIGKETNKSKSPELKVTTQTMNNMLSCNLRLTDPGNVVTNINKTVSRSFQRKPYETVMRTKKT
jgi:S-adenosylmethionine hydrolase